LTNKRFRSYKRDATKSACGLAVGKELLHQFRWKVTVFYLYRAVRVGKASSQLRALLTHSGQLRQQNSTVPLLDLLWVCRLNRGLSNRLALLPHGQRLLWVRH
jgi:hypothetical protein